MLKQIFEVYFNNIGYFAALATVMTIVSVCFEALASAFPSQTLLSILF